MKKEEKTTRTQESEAPEITAIERMRKIAAEAEAAQRPPKRTSDRVVELTRSFSLIRDDDEGDGAKKVGYCCWACGQKFYKPYDAVKHFKNAVRVGPPFRELPEEDIVEIVSEAEWCRRRALEERRIREWCGEVDGKREMNVVIGKKSDDEVGRKILRKPLRNYVIRIAIAGEAVPLLGSRGRVAIVTDAVRTMFPNAKVTTEMMNGRPTTIVDLGRALEPFSHIEVSQGKRNGEPVTKVRAKTL